jgi:hypothetical protein
LPNYLQILCKKLKNYNWLLLLSTLKFFIKTTFNVSYSVWLIIYRYEQQFTLAKGYTNIKLLLNDPYPTKKQFDAKVKKFYPGIYPLLLIIMALPFAYIVWWGECQATCHTNTISNYHF